MLFSSIPFLYYFLPAVLLTYFLVPWKLKNAVLLLFSLAFYAWGGLYYLLLMLSSIAVNYFGALIMEKAAKTPAARKWALIGTVIVGTGLSAISSEGIGTRMTVSLDIYTG